MFFVHFLFLIILWLFGGWIVYRLWRRWKPIAFWRKFLHVAIGVLLFSLWFGGAFWEVSGKKMYWDVKVRELCAKDGGIRIYETVTLPAEKYDQYANRNWILPDESQVKPSDEYFAQRELIYFRRSNPQVTRFQSRIIRHSDGQILGECVFYGRGGGDLPGPWHGSSFMCPDPLSIQFAVSVFLRGNDEHY